MKKFEFKELEADIQAKILKALRKLPGAYVWKAHTGGRYATRGIPDIMFVRDGQLYALEVKRPGELPTPLQKETMDKLQQAGAVVAVVYNVEERWRW